MNPKSTRYSFGKGRQKKDDFRGRRGKDRKKQLYASKPKSWQLIDEEISKLQSQYETIDTSAVQKFSDFPLSRKTQNGLKLSKYDIPTEIQRESIGLALQGNDILGAAKTGSGKTLAFLIPVLECLFHQKWSQQDGLGALIISPTRELAYQTFEVLKKIGKYHDFSAGLVIGGKHLREESERINKTNIVICTPGRLLQHMDETVHFTADSLQVLVLDEADRILDLGFAQTMNAVIENLPSTRQTLLFSATQTKSVKDLARLSLKDPMYVSVHENAKHSTPAQLEQSYIVCELHEKINMLWSFVKNHLKNKTLVFLASCKQVKYIHELFRRLRPGVTVLALHGAMHQLKRVAVYNQFCRKQNAVLFATDIAARGLDFPAVNWVIQMDCPEDANTYIHRAGRTARYEKNGQALLVLLPSEEEAMVKHFKDKKIPIENIKVNSKKLWSITPKLQSLLASDPALKETAQRAFLGYLRSIFFMSDKNVFDVHKLDTEKYSSSLGLAIPPKVRFLKREQKRLAEKEAVGKLSKTNTKQLKSSEIADSDSESESKSESDSDDEGISTSDSDQSSKDNRLLGQSSSDESEACSDNGNLSDKKKRIADLLTGKMNSKKLNEDQKLKENRTSKRNDSLEDSGKLKDSDSNVVTGSEGYKFDIDEDNDDLFTVKSRQLYSDSDETNEEEEDIQQSKDGTKDDAKKEKVKVMTKYAVAKKLQKKNIQVNTKVVFNEEGEVIGDELKKPRTAKQSKEDEYEGGINIEAAKKQMLEEDVFDKKLYREKIKKKHKEERLKQKEKKRGKKKKDENEEEEEAMDAVLDTGKEEEADPFDLLPDPDKIYGEQEVDSEEDSGSSEEGESSPKKRKMQIVNSESEDETYNSDNSDANFDNDESDENDDESNENDSDDDMDTGLSLQDDEDIALKLLSG